MPILSGNIAELAEELKQFEKDNKAAVDKVTAGLTTLQAKHAAELEAARARLDAIEVKARQLPATQLPGGQLNWALMQLREFRERPSSLARGQSLQFTVSTKNVVSGVSRLIPYETGVVAPGPAPALRLRAILPSVPIDSGSIQYIRETAFVNNAAPVAEAAVKPQSDLTYLNVNAPVETIAHWTKIAKQTYNDLPALANAMENRLIYGLLAKEENQLLNGSGVTPNLTGFLTVAPAAAAAPAGSTLVDALALAAGSLAAIGYTPTAAVVNPSDWTTSNLTKSTTEQYIIVPAGLLPPIIQCASMSVGKWLVGDFVQGCTLYERTNATLQIAAYNEDDYIKNLLTLLCELREVLAIYQSAAFLQGTVPAVA